MSQRLTRAHLGGLGSDIAVPGYLDEDPGVGLVHLGVGAFHRAHQALYTEALLRQGAGDWRICGVSLRNAAMRDALAPQDNLYAVQVTSPDAPRFEIVGAIAEMLVAPEDPGAVIAALARPGTAVITLTITEKGYCLNPATGELDLEHGDIQHDLANLTAPVSALGFLAAGLAARRDVGVGGVTLLSCDNLAANGRKLHGALLAFASRIDPQLAQWIDTQCRFPCSMVDRIVPATTDDQRAAFTSVTGIEDAALVVTEPFSQWVIEDDFAGPRPDWHAVGADLVADVAPFEEMKLRQLNASHSTLAYLGFLAGYSTVDAAIADPAMHTLISHLMRVETAPSLQGLGDFDLGAYQQQLLQRFANPGLAHRTRQIAMDGSQKIPQRLLPALEWQLENQGPIDALCLGVAGWVRYTRGVDEQGGVYSVEDPLSERLARAHRAAGSAAQDYLAAILALDEVFPPSLAANPHFRAGVLYWLRLLASEGAAAVITAFAAGSRIS